MVSRIVFYSSVISDLQPLTLSVSDYSLPELPVLQGAILAGNDTWTLQSISATSVTVGFGGTFTVTASGSGFGPVSTWQQLENAVRTGTATGVIDSIVLADGSTTLATIDLHAGGYDMAVGDLLFSVNGALPSNVNTLFDLVQLFVIDFAYRPELVLSPAELQALVTEMAPYAIDGFSLSYAGENIVSFSADATGFRLEAFGYVLAIEGNFAGQWETIGELVQLFFDLGSDPTGAAANALLGQLDSARFTLPDGQVLVEVIPDPSGLTTTNAITYLDSLPVALVDIDFSNSSQIHDQWSETQSVAVYATGGDDTVIGGQGKDLLTAGGGR